MARRTMQRVGAMLAVGAVALPAVAQEEPHGPRPRYELTPYAAYRFGGESSNSSTMTATATRTAPSSSYAKATRTV